jgi:transposase InsO family protein
MDERRRFVGEARRGLYTVSELCERYGISRKTGYKWLERFEKGGEPALEDRSHCKHTFPNGTDPEVLEAILACRQRHPTWGSRKIRAVAQARLPNVDWPAASTIGDILKRHGLVVPRRRRSKPVHPGQPTTEYRGPNDIWAADFKGEFKTGDGLYCYPLTVTDGYSRYLLGCKALRSTAHIGAQAAFKRLFREYGLPAAILTDNGVPFASTGRHHFSQLSVWWIRLGIQPLLIEPGRPDQNGRHERMHRTMKREATQPPQAELRAQQREFDRFRLEYNEVRPHEAIGQKPPASLYQASPRPFPERLSAFEYPRHFKVRKVCGNGALRWGSRFLNVCRPLIGEYIGLEEVDDGVWSVYFCDVLIGRFDATKEWRIRG